MAGTFKAGTTVTLKTKQGGNKSKASKREMPMCTYGAACNRRDCIYRHPPKSAKPKPPEPDENAPVCMAFVAGWCTFGAHCRNLHVDAQQAEEIRAKCAKTQCTWGWQCTNEACLFSHPEWAPETCPEVPGQSTQAPYVPEEPYGYEYPALEGAEGYCQPDEHTWGQDVVEQAWAPEEYPAASAQDEAVAAGMASLRIGATEFMPSAAAPAFTPMAAGSTAWGGGGGMSFAAVAKASADAPTPAANSSGGQAWQPQVVKVPQEFWVDPVLRNPDSFHIADPLERFQANQLSGSAEVGNWHALHRHLTAPPGMQVVDMHFQSVKTAPIVRAAPLSSMLSGLSHPCCRQVLDAVLEGALQASPSSKVCGVT